MSDLPSSLGIEAVECVAEGGRSLTVRVTGRWLRRRPEPRGQAMLIVETDAGRQRFPAMPEPPSLTGAAPGTWRMTFSVPAELAPVLPGRTFLQLGGVMVPLPIVEVTIPDGPDPELLEARRARGSELAAESARRRAAELAGDVARLERELGEAREQSDRLRGEIAEREGRLRRSEQDAHAERALRAEIEQELTRRTRAAQHDLSVLHERTAELERELTRTRRAVDEAGHLAAAAGAARAEAEAARAEAERRLAEGPPVAPTPPEARLSEPRPSESVPLEPAQSELAARESAPAEPALPPTPPPVLDRARAERTRRERELDAAARALDRPRAPLTPLLGPAAGRAAHALEAALVARRALRTAGDVERVSSLELELAAAREEAEAQRRRSARAYEAIELVRAELRELRETAPPPVAPPAPPATPSEPAPGEPVQAERLSEALARLRERTPVALSEEPGESPVSVEPASPEPAPPGLAAVAPSPTPDRPVRPWLAPAFRELTARDASSAGRLLLGLLPAQRAADPHPIAYDLVLSDVLCAHVTVTSTSAYVELDATRRALSEVDFQLVGDLASIARLLVAGRLRRRLGRLAPRRRPARVRGERGRIGALDELLAARLTLRDLGAAGVELDPLLTLTVAGLMVEPAWTAGERFTIAHREPAHAAPGAFLQVRDGRPVLASAQAPHGPVASVISCRGPELLGALGGESAGIQVAGEERPLKLLHQWLDRAQCG